MSLLFRRSLWSHFGIPKYLLWLCTYIGILFSVNRDTRICYEIQLHYDIKNVFIMNFKKEINFSMRCRKTRAKFLVFSHIDVKKLHSNRTLKICLDKLLRTFFRSFPSWKKYWKSTFSYYINYLNIFPNNIYYCYVVYLWNLLKQKKRNRM